MRLVLSRVAQRGAGHMTTAAIYARKSTERDPVAT